MDQPIANQKKYENYREQMGRLSKALKEHFYLEAIFIEYAILEDRLEAVLRHANHWHPKEGEHVSIDRKVRLVVKLAEEKTNPARRYFPAALTDAILAWKNRRNGLIHALLKQELHSEDLLSVAEDGLALAKQMCSKATSHRRMLERMEKQKSTGKGVQEHE